MVQYDTDGSTLYYIDASGTKISCSKYDWQYNVLDSTIDLQISAVWQNRQFKNNYLTALSNAQGNVNAGRPVAAPEKPNMIQVLDPTQDKYGIITAGVSSEGNYWNPPLPDLVPLKVVGAKGIKAGK